MMLKNNIQRYGLVAILLHWLIAIFVIGLLCMGLYMAGLPLSLQKLKFYGWHKEFGILVLMLMMLRLLWTLINIKPELPATLPYWQVLAARATHWAFYGFLVVMPLTGWMMSSAAGVPVSFFGLFILPNLVPADPQLKLLLQGTHEWLAYVLMGVIGLHVAAALKHHFIDKDDILRRML